jgi:predicted nucleotidyltransferase
LTAELSDIVARLQAHKSLLLDEYSLSQIGIFGSYVHNSQTAASDLDILIDVAKPMGLFKFVHLKNHLTDLLGVQVDLVMKSALKPALSERILQETRYL